MKILRQVGITDFVAKSGFGKLKNSMFLLLFVVSSNVFAGCFENVTVCDPDVIKYKYTFSGPASCSAPLPGGGSVTLTSSNSYTLGYEPWNQSTGTWFPNYWGVQRNETHIAVLITSDEAGVSAGYTVCQGNTGSTDCNVNFNGSAGTFTAGCTVMLPRTKVETKAASQGACRTVLQPVASVCGETACDIFRTVHVNHVDLFQSDAKSFCGACDVAVTTDERAATLACTNTYSRNYLVSWLVPVMGLLLR